VWPCPFYAFVAILGGLAAAFMLHLVSVAAAQAQAQQGNITIAHAVKVCAAAFFALLIMRQVLPMASGLASGFALSSYGIVSGLFEGVGVRNRQRIAEFSRGFFDDGTTRWDPWPRKAGYRIKSFVKSRFHRDNSIRE
jgi:type IV secretion system protein VirB6